MRLDLTISKCVGAYVIFLIVTIIFAYVDLIRLEVALYMDVFMMSIFMNWLIQTTPTIEEETKSFVLGCSVLMNLANLRMFFIS